MILQDWEQELEEIGNVFGDADLTEIQKKELVFNIITHKVMAKPEFKLYPADDNSEESNFQKYQTKDGQYSLTIAYDHYNTGAYYFYIGNGSNINESYNSLWENKKFKTQETCIKAAETWLFRYLTK